MKKFFVITLALVLCLGILASCGEKKRVDVSPFQQNSEFATDANGDLSAVLPIDDHEGAWSYSSIDNTTAIEVIKDEQLEGDDGVLTQYYVFSSDAKEFTEFTMTFTYADTKGGKAVKGYNVKLTVPGDGMVLVKEVSEFVPGEETAALPDENLSLDDEGRLVVSLDANPSTGYHWEYEIAEDASIKFVSAEDVATVNGDEPIDGAPTVWKATFEGVATEDGEPHPAVITFTYYAPDGTPSDTTYTAMALVLGDGTLIIAG